MVMVLSVRQMEGIPGLVSGRWLLTVSFIRESQALRLSAGPVTAAGKNHWPGRCEREAPCS